MKTFFSDFSDFEPFFAYVIEKFIFSLCDYSSVGYRTYPQGAIPGYLSKNENTAPGDGRFGEGRRMKTSNR